MKYPNDEERLNLELPQDVVDRIQAVAEAEGITFDDALLFIVYEATGRFEWAIQLGAREGLTAEQSIENYLHFAPRAKG